MRVYVICAVRQAALERTADYCLYAADLRTLGCEVFFPPDNAPQDDPTGKAIVECERQAIADADEVHVFWDVESKGSHFDLGMAYALGKKIVPVRAEQPDNPGKSYWKAILS